MPVHGKTRVRRSRLDSVVLDARHLRRDRVSALCSSEKLTRCPISPRSLADHFHCDEPGGMKRPLSLTCFGDPEEHTMSYTERQHSKTRLAALNLLCPEAFLDPSTRRGWLTPVVLTNFGLLDRFFTYGETRLCDDTHLTDIHCSVFTSSRERLIQGYLITLAGMKIPLSLMKSQQPGRDLLGNIL